MIHDINREVAVFRSIETMTNVTPTYAHFIAIRGCQRIRFPEISRVTGSLTLQIYPHHGFLTFFRSNSKPLWGKRFVRNPWFKSWIAYFNAKSWRHMFCGLIFAFAVLFCTLSEEDLNLLHLLCLNHSFFCINLLKR